MSITGSVQANVSINNTKDGVDLSTPNESLALNARKTFTTDTFLYHDQIAISGNTPYTLTLSGGGLEDQFGQAIDFSAVTTIYVKCVSGCSGLYLSGGSDMIFNPLPPLEGGEGFLYQGDITVTVGASELTLVCPASGLVDLVLVGL